MKKRYTGGFAVVVFALGFMLSQFWNFGGLGTGEGQGSGDGEATTDASNQDADLSNVSTGGEVSSTTNMSSADQPVPNAEFVTIVIHDERYRLTSEADPQSGVDISLSEVVRQVSESTGGAQGVKLRILFEKNAQAGAIADLHAALQEKGVNREEIQEITEYVN